MLRTTTRMNSTSPISQDSRTSTRTDADASAFDALRNIKAAVEHTVAMKVTSSIVGRCGELMAWPPSQHSSRYRYMMTVAGVRPNENGTT